MLGDNSERVTGDRAEAPELAGAERRNARLRSKLDLGDPRDDRFQGPGYRLP